MARRRRHGAVIGGAAVLLAVFVLLALFDSTATTPARGPSTSPVGTWAVTYGAPAMVRIDQTGTNAYTMKASSRVTVVRSTCQLPVGTVLATFTGHGSSYTGRHGLWNVSTCVFDRWAGLSLTVSGPGAATAQAKLDDGESLSYTRSAAAPVAASHRFTGWLWIGLAVLVVVLTAGYLWASRRRREST